MLLFGGAVFDGLIVPPALRGRLLRSGVAAILAVLISITALAWFALETGEIGNGWSDAIDPNTLSAVATSTPFGAVWIGRLILIVLLFAALIPGRGRRWPLIVCSGLVLATLGLVGHAAMQDGVWGIFHRGSHMLHLLAAGFWLGALPPLVATLLLMRRPEAQEAGAAALHRFSGLGHIAVALVLVSGGVNTWLSLGAVPIDFRSPYQGLLALKIAVVALMIGIALGNRYMLAPRLAADPARARRGLVVGALAEIALGAVVVALVSAFATFDPV
jgi:putative copper resistance protein D